MGISVFDSLELSHMKKNEYKRYSFHEMRECRLVDI